MLLTERFKWLQTETESISHLMIYQIRLFSSSVSCSFQFLRFLCFVLHHKASENEMERKIAMNETKLMTKETEKNKQKRGANKNGEELFSVQTTKRETIESKAKWFITHHATSAASIIVSLPFVWNFSKSIFCQLLVFCQVIEANRIYEKENTESIFVFRLK